MVGIVKVDTLQNNAGTSSVGMDYVVNGSAKMWATVDQTSTHTVDDSFNLASVTDNGTGRTEFAFSTAMNNANYCVTGMTRDGGGYNDDAGIHADEGGAYSTSAIELTALFGGSPNDCDSAMWAVVQGDLA